MSARHPGGICAVNLPPEAGQSWPIIAPFHYLLWPIPFVHIKKESSSGGITIDVHQGTFCWYAVMPRAVSKYLTDSEGSTVNVCLILFLYFDLFSRLNVLEFYFLNACVKILEICRRWFSLEQNCWFIEDKLSSTAVDFIRSEGIAERQHFIWGKASSLSMPRT